MVESAKYLGKIIVVSAVLSLSLVTVVESQIASGAAPSAKPFIDRLPQQIDASTLPVKTVSLGARGSVPDALADLRPEPLAKSDKLGSATASCAGQAWPYVEPDCVTPVGSEAARKVVRTITIEDRQQPNTSVLVRMPITDVASR